MSFCQCGCGLETELAQKTLRKIGWIKGQPTLAEWAQKLSINYGTLKSRLRYGWTIERVLTEKVRIQ